MSAETRPGTIGIIGAGHIGQAFARVAQRGGREVLIANSRGPESLSPVVAALGEGVSAGTVAEAAASALVVIAVPWASVPAAVGGLVWNGKIVIDATNASTEREVEISAVIGASKGLATAAVRTARLPQTDASAPVGGASR